MKRLTYTIIAATVLGIAAISVKATIIIGGPLQSWRPPPPVVTLPVTSDLAFAGSCARKLVSGYTGYAINVRRSSDNATNDIGFKADGTLDTTTLLAWAGSDNVFIVILYDQSGSANNLINVTTADQPQIVASGSLIAGSNSRAAALMDNTDVLALVTPTDLPVTYFMTINNGSPVTSGKVIFRAGSSTRMALLQSASSVTLNSGTPLTSDDTLTANTWYLATAYIESGTSDTIRINANTPKTGDAGNATGTQIQIGAGGTGTAVSKWSELIIYHAALSGTDETSVRNNINAFYAIY